MNADHAIEEYLRTVRDVRASGGGTAERSFYPALQALLDSLGELLSPKASALTDPAGRSGDFPDLVVLDKKSSVLALPVEVKPPSTHKTVADLLGVDQGKRYASTFGGGWVLLTNVRLFLLARLASSGNLEEVMHAEIVAAESDLDVAGRPLVDPADRLLALLELGTEPRATLTHPRQVADHLAFHAREMVEAINDAARGKPAQLLSAVHEIFKSGLEAELDEEMFVPTIVQTLVYGLFASWLSTEDDDFDWQSAAYRVDVPLFAEVLHACLSPKLIRKCNLVPRLAGAAGVFERVDKDWFSKQFAGSAIEYFYEPFLASFDPHLRDRLGVWYTPSEIAEYQAARCHHHLRHDLGIDAGLADDQVIVLDPASGTGTYLAAVLRHIYNHHVKNGEPHAISADRVRAAALTRVVGFEILPAAFVISHLHIARTLESMGAGLREDERLRIYLTNSLTGWDPLKDNPKMVLFPDLEDELASARAIKQSEPVLVVLGNPPYEGYSTAQTEEEENLVKPWTAPLWPMWGIRKHRLNDLYVRFWRIGVERIAALTGRGVVSFITNRQWLGGRSYPAMRESLLHSFDRIVVDDLHGGYHDRSHSGDESIFTTKIAAGIRVGTAIVTATRTVDHDDDVATVQGRDLRGRANDKRQQLRNYSAGGIDDGLVDRTPSRNRAWRLTEDPAGDFPLLGDYFDFFLSGVQPVRDEAVLSEDRAELELRFRDYFNKSIDWEDLISAHPGFGITRRRYDGRRVRNKLLSSSTFNASRVVRYLHKPFDARWMYWEPEHKLLNEARAELQPYWLTVDKQTTLVCTQTRRREGAARPLVGGQVPGFAAMDPDCRALPLWKPADTTGLLEGQLGHGKPADIRPNIRKPWIEAAKAAGVPGTKNQVAEIVFYAIAGICVSPDWLDAQPIADSDFPTVPLPDSADGLRTAADLGRRYGALVDPDVAVSGVTTGAIRPELRGLAVPDAVQEDPVLSEGRLGFHGGHFEQNDLRWGDTGAWRNVPDGAWELRLGGFQPISKWLSYRVGQLLTAKDRQYVTHLVRRLAAIEALFDEANAIYRRTAAAPLDTV